MTCLYFGMDDDRSVTSGLGASATSITGFTEWISHGIPAITIGWDWELAGTDGKPCLLQTGIPRRSIMFVDQLRRSWWAGSKPSTGKPKL